MDEASVVNTEGNPHSVNQDILTRDDENAGAHPPARLDHCKICLERDVPDFITLPCAGQHTFCKECLMKYAEAMVTDGSTKQGSISCPAEGCGAAIDEAAMKAFTTPALFEKHRFFCRQHQVAVDPALRWCPRPGCSMIVRIAEGKRTGVCSSCSMKLCAACGSRAHPLRTCSMAADGAFERWREAKLWTAEGVKRCPRCRFLIEKDGGCRHMTCRQCRHSFCWRCGSDWTQSTTCERPWLCQLRAVLDSPMWGRSTATRALAKTTAVALGVPLTLATAAVAAAGAVVGGVGFVVSLPAMRVRAHIQRVRADREMAAYRHRVLLICGINVVLVHLGGLAQSLSQQVAGRWIEDEEGRRRTYAAYGRINNNPALLYVHNGLRPYALYMATQEGGSSPVQEGGAALPPPVAADREEKDEASEPEGGAADQAAEAAAEPDGGLVLPSRPQRRPSYPPFTPRRTLVLCPYEEGRWPPLTRPDWSAWQSRATVVQVQPTSDQQQHGLRLHLATPRGFVPRQPRQVLVLPSSSSGGTWPQEGGADLLAVVQAVLEARWMD